jgi:hypothetical protein
LEKKRGVGGARAALQYLWSLKKGTRTFDFRSNEPSSNLLVYWFDIISAGENIKKEKKKIRDLSSSEKEFEKFHILYTGA